MLRLTFLLCSAIFLTMLIGGRDYGQTRFGLASAVVDTDLQPQPLIQPVEVASLDRQTGTASLAQAASTPIVIEPAAAPMIQPIALEDTAPMATPVALEETAPLLYVTAQMVNVRSGPSTSFPVIDRLSEGEAALLVGTDEAGWAPIRIEGDGVEGYVSSKYLSSIAPY